MWVAHRKDCLGKHEARLQVVEDAAERSVERNKVAMGLKTLDDGKECERTGTREIGFWSGETTHVSQPRPAIQITAITYISIVVLSYNDRGRLPTVHPFQTL